MVASTFDSYEVCEDYLDLCNSNSSTMKAMQGKELSEALTEPNSVAFFKIGNLQDDTRVFANPVPRNYFCKWRIELDSRKAYYL